MAEIRHQDSSAAVDGRVNTTCRFVCDDVDGEYRLRHLGVTEELGRPYRIEARLHAAHEHNLQFFELIGKDAAIVAERPDGARRWTGIVAEIVNVERDLKNGAVITVV